MRLNFSLKKVTKSGECVSTPKGLDKLGSVEADWD